MAQIPLSPGEIEACRQFLTIIWGDKFDWTNEHFKDTPRRFVRMLKELTTPEEYQFTTFASRNDEMVVLGPIHFSSMCAHHIIPFVGECWVGYVPNKTIVGLSKIPRLVKAFARTLTVQEELTTAIGNELMTLLQPIGVAVVMKAEHMCMSIRGVQEHDTMTTTSFMEGCFADHNRLARSEFLSLIGA